MRIALKPIRNQVIVITGASSGIGLATARLAAKRGASVVLAARNKDVLDTIAGEIEQAGGTAMSFALDVANKADVEKLAEAAIARFGRIDTWVNDAGIGVFGKLEEVSDEDNRRMFETNFWGLVNGSLVAVRHLKQEGGALINLGSVVSGISMPLQAMYATTKHAILGFTDGLRMELMSEDAPISVTLIRPSAIGTPFGNKGKNYLAQEAQLPPPLYKVEDVASAIVYAASHVKRDLWVGGGGRMMDVFNRLAPGLMDRVAVKGMPGMVKDEPARPRRDNLNQTASEGEEMGTDLSHGPLPAFYTRAVTHPVTTLAVVAAATGLLAAVTHVAIELNAARMDPKLRARRWMVKTAAPVAAKYGRYAARHARDYLADEVAPKALKYGSRAASAGRDYAREELLPRASRYGSKAAEKAQDLYDDEIQPRARRYAKRARKQACRWWQRL